MVVLREALSKQNTLFVKLPSISNNAPELNQLTELYRLGISTYRLARPFGTDRHTITRHLRRDGVTLRPREKPTPQLVEQAKRLYADGYSLAVIGKQLGFSPTTIGTALRKVGVRLRDRHGQLK